MATKFTLAHLSSRLEWKYEFTEGAYKSEDNEAQTRSLSFHDGDTVTLVDRVYRQQHVLTSGTQTLTLDLAGGGMLDPFGATLFFAKVFLLVVTNLGTVAGDDIVVGNSGASSFNGPWNGVDAGSSTVPPKSHWVASNMDTGWTVTNGAIDLLKFDNIAATNRIEFEVEILGTTA